MDYKKMIDYPELNPEVRRICDKYKDYILGWMPSSEYDPNDKRFYVYAWFTKGTEKKVFYVGKGNGSRYRHILKEIEDFENNTGKYKGSPYKRIKDRCGIDYEILISGITSYEAELYEYCMMREYTLQGEVLLNRVDMPFELMDEDELNYPNIEKDKFYERYLDDFTVPEFDKVDLPSLMATCFCDAHVDKTPENIKDRQIISDKISSMGGRVYRRLCKSAKSIIIQGGYPYENWIQDHANGIKVYSSKDVLAFL